MLYLDGVSTNKSTDPDNPLILGQAVHTGIEKDLEAAIREYAFSYPIITDEHINEIMKLEKVIPLVRETIPRGGQFEVEVKDDDFHGFIDYLVPIGYTAGDTDSLVQEALIVANEFDLYDFKYSNNVSRYKDSKQLHLYKYFFERDNPGKKIRNMYFVFVPKVSIRQKKTETLQEFRNRLTEELANVEVKTVQIEFNIQKVIEFLFEIKAVNEETEFPREKVTYADIVNFKNIARKEMIT